MAPAASGMLVGEGGGDEALTGGQGGSIALLQQQSAVLLQRIGQLQQLQSLNGPARQCRVRCCSHLQPCVRTIAQYHIRRECLNGEWSILPLLS